MTSETITSDQIENSRRVFLSLALLVSGSSGVSGVSGVSRSLGLLGSMGSLGLWVFSGLLGLWVSGPLCLWVSRSLGPLGLLGLG